MTTEPAMDLDTRTDAAIYAEYSVELVRFATSLVGPIDAPDVVANAFVQLMTAPIWLAAHNHRAQLYRRVVFEARTWQRSAVRRRTREDRAARTAVAEFADLQPEVAAAVRALSPQQRAVVFLTYWNDLTPASIAELLGVSDGTVRKQLARARTHLKKALS